METQATQYYRYLAYNLCRFVLYLRRRLLSLLSGNPLAASAIEDLCSQFPLFFIELFCLLPYIAELTPFSIQHQLYKHQTKKQQRSGNPAELKASPFIPFKYQQSLIKTLVKRINSVNCLPGQEHQIRRDPGSIPPEQEQTSLYPPLLIQKASSIGATTAVLLVYLWYFLFKPQSTFLIMTPNLFDLYMPKLKNHARIPVFNFLMFVIQHLPCHRACPDFMGEPANSTEAKKHASSCHRACPDSIGEPANQSEAKKHASERSPERKHENEQSPSPERKQKKQHPFFIPGTGIKFVINRKKNFYCYLENTANGNRIIGISAGTKRDINEILNSLPAPQPPIAQQYEKVSSSGSNQPSNRATCPFFSKESRKKTSMKPTSSQPSSSTLFSNESGKETSTPPTINQSTQGSDSDQNMERRDEVPMWSSGSHATFTSVLLDDLAFQTHADHHYPQLQRLTNSIIALSSPNGNNNLFAELKDRSHKDDLFILHWILNPLYDRAWYNSLTRIASANFVEQFINLEFTHRYRSASPHKTGQATANKETGDQNTTEANSPPASTPVPPDGETQTRNNLNNSLPEAAFRQQHVKATTRKKLAIFSCLTGLKRKAFKSAKSLSSSPYLTVKSHLSCNNIENSTLPASKTCNPIIFIKGWLNLHNIINNNNSLILESKQQAILTVNLYSELKIPDSIIPHEPQDSARPNEHEIDFKALFFTVPIIRLLPQKILAELKRKEEELKRQQELDELTVIFEENARQIKEKVEEILARFKQEGLTDPDKHEERMQKLRDELAARNPEQNSTPEHNEKPQTTPETPANQPPAKDDRNNTPPDNSSENKIPKSAPPGNLTPPQLSLKEQQRKREEENKLLYKNNLTPEGKFGVKSTGWNITINPPPPPKPKPEPPKPEPVIYQPPGSENQPDCPPDAFPCPLTTDNPVPCYPECPHYEIYLHNQKCRQEWAKELEKQQKASQKKKKPSKSKTNKAKTKKNKPSNRGRPPPPGD